MATAAQQIKTSVDDVSDDLIRLSFGCSVKEINESERWADFVLSTDAVDSYGEVVVQDWNLTRYEANPVVLYGHRSWELPIGHAENVRVEKRKLIARLYFVNEKANPLAEQVWQGIVQKSIRAVSVGFRSKAGSAKEIDGNWIYVLTGNELVEVSVVPIGANPEAVALRSKSMNVIRGLAGDAANTNTASDVPAKENEMSVLLKSLVAVLGLSANASEEDVIASVNAVKSNKDAAEKAKADAVELHTKSSGDVAKVLEAVGVDSIEKALGVIEASKDAVASLAKAKADLDAFQVEKLIEDAKRERKITPHQVEKLHGKSIDFVKSFLDMQVPNPVIADDGIRQPEAKDVGVNTFKGKSFGDLTPGEKHELYTSNKSLYDAMKAAASN